MSEPVDRLPDSWYAATAHEQPRFEPLDGAVRCDVCVVGGGLTGLSAALELAARGFDVRLVEARRIGWGASGRSGGQVIFGYSCGMDRLERLVGAGSARILFDASLDALALVRRNIARHRIDCDLHNGVLHAAIKPRQRTELIAWRDEMANRYGYRHPQLVEGDALAAHVSSDRYVAALYDANSFHLHPLNYTLGLARAAAAAGVTLHEQTEALEIRGGGRRLVLTANGEIACRSIVLCGNAYLGRLTATLHKTIMPVGTYVAATEPLGDETASGLLPSGAAVSDVNFVLDYFRRSPDHRLLFGGRVSYSGFNPVWLRRAMRKRIARVFPQVADARIDYLWGGHVAITRNRAPHFGRVAPDIWFAQGYSGHGMALSTLAGQLLAEAVAGTESRFDVFEKIAHRNFPGGALLRMPALVLAMAWYRLRDLV